MAFNIFSSTATSSTNNSGALGPKPSANAAADLFSTHLTQPESKPTSHRAAKSKPNPAPHKQDKPAAGDDTDKAGSSKSAKASKPAKAQADSHTDDSGSQTDDQTTDSEKSAAAAEASGANGTAKGGRTAGRNANAKTTTSETSDPKTAADTADPSADDSNASGLSLLQLLARSLESKDSGTSAVASDPNGTGTSGQPADGGSNDSTTDPNALALAMMSQALAASFAAAPGAAAAASAATQGTAATGSQAPGNGAAGVGSATSGATAAQQLVALLAKDLAASDKGKTDADAVQSDVADTKSSSGDTSAADNTTPNAQSIAQSFAQLGAPSHFSRDTNIADLKAQVGTPAWNEELGGHLTWMSHSGLESGSLRVSPEHLGPVEVQISVQNGDASVWFGANHPDTRAALEQALPKLREMFANQGLTLTDSGVSREPPRNQGRPATSHGVTSVSAIGSSEGSTPAASRISLGLIDTYA